MLDDLVGVIETLKTRIQDHRADLQASETRTRMALIDPLLTALGWDTSNPRLVTPEYASNGRADYALLSPDSPPAALVEAKKLGEALEPHRMQMLNYSNASGVAFSGLTDGNHWELYDVFRKDTLDKRRVLELSISDTPAHKCALELLLLWRPNLASGEPIKANGPIGGVEQPNAEPDWIALSAFNAKPRTKPPSIIRFPDGAEHTVQYWWQLGKYAAEWLVSTGRLTQPNLPIPSISKGYIVNTEATHPSGNAFQSPKSIEGTSWKLESHGNASACRQKAMLVLKHCNVDPATVSVRVDQ